MTDFWVLIVRPFQPAITLRDEVRDRYARGDSTREIAEALNVRISTVRRILGFYRGCER